MNANKNILYVIYCVTEWLSHGKCFNLTGLYPIIFTTSSTNLHSHQQSGGFTLLTNCWYHQTLIPAIPMGIQLYLVEILISIFLIANENKHIFHINRQLHFLVCELRVICSFSYVDVFLLLIYRTSLYFWL